MRRDENNEMEKEAEQQDENKKIGVAEVSEEVEERDGSEGGVEDANEVETEREGEEDDDDKNDVTNNSRICKNKVI